MQNFKTIFEYNGDGATTNYLAPTYNEKLSTFEVIVDSYITFDWSFDNNTNEVVFNTAPLLEESIIIRRVTFGDYSVVDFNYSNIIKSDFLNLEKEQQFDLITEITELNEFFFNEIEINPPKLGVTVDTSSFGSGLFVATDDTPQKCFDRFDDLYNVIEQNKGIEIFDGFVDSVVVDKVDVEFKIDVVKFDDFIQELPDLIGSKLYLKTSVYTIVYHEGIGGVGGIYIPTLIDSVELERTVTDFDDIYDGMYISNIDGLEEEKTYFVNFEIYSVKTISGGIEVRDSITNTHFKTFETEKLGPTKVFSADFEDRIDSFDMLDTVNDIHYSSYVSATDYVRIASKLENISYHPDMTPENYIYDKFSNEINRIPLSSNECKSMLIEVGGGLNSKYGFQNVLNFDGWYFQIYSNKIKLYNYINGVEIGYSETEVYSTKNDSKTGLSQIIVNIYDDRIELFYNSEMLIRLYTNTIYPNPHDFYLKNIAGGPIMNKVELFDTTIDREYIDIYHENLLERNLGAWTALSGYFYYSKPSFLQNVGDKFLIQMTDRSYRVISKDNPVSITTLISSDDLWGAYYCKYIYQNGKHYILTNGSSKIFKVFEIDMNDGSANYLGNLTVDAPEIYYLYLYNILSADDGDTGKWIARNYSYGIDFYSVNVSISAMTLSLSSLNKSGVVEQSDFSHTNYIGEINGFRVWVGQFKNGSEYNLGLYKHDYMNGTVIREHIAVSENTYLTSANSVSNNQLMRVNGRLFYSAETKTNLDGIENNYRNYLYEIDETTFSFTRVATLKYYPGVPDIANPGSYTNFNVDYRNGKWIGTCWSGLMFEFELNDSETIISLSDSSTFLMAAKNWSYYFSNSTMPRNFVDFNGKRYTTESNSLGRVKI